MKKAQAIITDLLVALAIGIVLLIIINLTWDYYSAKLTDDAEYSDMFVRASQISEVLVSTKGYPSNWDYTNYVIIGLAQSDRNISDSKLANFSLLNNSQIKEAFKINLYNFTFNLVYIKNNTGIALIGENNSNATTSVNSRRLVLYKNETATLSFIIWK